MITRKGFIILIVSSIFCSVLLSFFFTQLSSVDIADIVEKNQTQKLEISPDTLIEKLQTNNSITKRETIVALGKNKTTAAIMPLFSLLMDASTTDQEVMLITIALYSITGGKISSYTIQLLENYVVEKKKPNAENNQNTTLLKDIQVINLLKLLTQITKEELEENKYNLEFLGEVIKSKNNTITLTALEVIANTAYSPLYYKVQDLYRTDLFIKIPVVQTITKIGLQYEKYYNNAIQFIQRQVKDETHPDVLEESYLSLYMLNQHLLDVPKNIEFLVKKIVSLNNGSFDVSLQQEEYLLQHHFAREEISLVQFFLSAVTPSRLKYRLLSILWADKDIQFLEQDGLIENIQFRYMDTGDSTDYLDLAKVSLKILGDRASELDDMRKIWTVISDKRFTYTLLEIFNRMLADEKKHHLLKNSINSIKQLLYQDTRLAGWFAYFTYTLLGESALKNFIGGYTETHQMDILHNISGCKIPSETRKNLGELYGSKSHIPFFQTVVDQFIQGTGVCYFG